jgi:hypothetical protein
MASVIVYVAWDKYGKAILGTTEKAEMAGLYLPFLDDSEKANKKAKL